MLDVGGLGYNVGNKYGTSGQRQAMFWTLIRSTLSHALDSCKASVSIGWQMTYTSPNQDDVI